MIRLIKGESSQYYFTGYSCDNAVVLAVGDERYFLTDARYTQEAKESVSRHTEVIEASDLMQALRNLIRSLHLTRITYDPLEWRLSDFKKLEAKLPRVTLHPKEGFLARARAVKSNAEVALLKTAAQIGAKGFDEVAAFLRAHGEGLSEKQLFFKATELLTGSGERPVSFEPILAVGANAAKPHALPTAVQLHSGDLLLMDAGIKHERYCSDRTRTVPFSSRMDFGTEQLFNDTEIQKAYDLVLKAHDTAIKQARVGMKAKELDAIAREIITAGGYGERFIHSLGHGVGLDIHEHPYINARNETVLEANMVFTIEPGIYLPGKFGIRIEDTVVLKDDGAHIL